MTKTKGSIAGMKSRGATIHDMKKSVAREAAMDKKSGDQNKSAAEVQLEKRIGNLDQ
jgi:hypothetical protein